MAMNLRRRWSMVVAILGAIASILAFWAMTGRDRSSPDQLAEQVREALKAGQSDRAERLLTKLTGRRPPTAADLVLKAELLLARKRHDEAIAVLTSIPESDELAPRTRFLAGQIEMSRWRARPAEAQLLEAVRLDPRLTLARRELVVLYGMQARRDRLSSQYRALAELTSLNLDDVLLWTVSLEDRWINDTIRPQLERLLATDPDDRWSRLALASVCLKAGEYDRTDTLLSALPDLDIEALVLRARLALARSELEKAGNLLASSPDQQVDLANLRGQVAMRRNDPETALRQFQIALRLDPSNREALQGISLLLQRLGRAQEAAAFRERADRWRELTDMLQQMKSAQPQADLPRRLGELCEVLGQPAQARAWYRLALDRDPLDEVAQRALYRIDRGG